MGGWSDIPLEIIGVQELKGGLSADSPPFLDQLVFVKELKSATYRMLAQ